jgi:protein-S-isoprenylcysteine O-methyltransferase Ste14
MTINPIECIPWIWAVLGLYWLVVAIRAKPVARKEHRPSRLAHLGLIALTFWLLFSERAPVGLLGARLIPQSPGRAWFGLALTAAGCTLALWARFWLGSNWSGAVAVKQGHELVRGGPYRIVRHPIYFGLLLAILGTALAIGELRGLVALPIAFTAWFSKARSEERFLVEQFGAVYLAYRREVKQLIPFLF